MTTQELKTKLQKVKGVEIVFTEENMVGYLLPNPVDDEIPKDSVLKMGYKNGYCTAFGVSDETLQSIKDLNEYIHEALGGFTTEITYSETQIPRLSMIEHETMKNSYTIGFDVCHLDSDKTHGTKKQCHDEVQVIATGFKRMLQRYSSRMTFNELILALKRHEYRQKRKMNYILRVGRGSVEEDDKSV